MRPLDGTSFEYKYGRTSKTCLPHGSIGQSWDGDNVGVNGATDDYTYNATHPVLTTKAMAEGAIEGNATEYELSTPFVTRFKYSRFEYAIFDQCKVRDIKLLYGTHNTKATQVAGSVDV